jgi:hypothetical protein
MSSFADPDKWHCTEEDNASKAMVCKNLKRDATVGYVKLSRPVELTERKSFGSIYFRYIPDSKRKEFILRSLNKLRKKNPKISVHLKRFSRCLDMPLAKLFNCDTPVKVTFFDSATGADDVFSMIDTLNTGNSEMVRAHWADIQLMSNF